MPKTPTINANAGKASSTDGDTNKKSSGTRRKKQANQEEPKSALATSFVGIMIVLLVAMLWQLVLSLTTQDTHYDSAATTIMNELVCRHKDGNCFHTKSLLKVDGRTHRATKSIAPNTVLFQIPRALQLWDLDALRFFKNHWKKGLRHKATGRPLDGGAYLAYYLWLRFEGSVFEKAGNGDTSNNIDDPLWPYYKALPRNVSYHPIAWSNDGDEIVKQRLYPHSHGYSVARAYRDMVQSEYQALAKRHDFQQEQEDAADPKRTAKKQLTLPDYQRFRILVLSRSFGTGPPDESETQPVIKVQADNSDESAPQSPQHANLTDELAYYNQTFGVDFTLGCRAMVPILDMYNHHATPNVEWRYESSKRSFIVTSSSSNTIDKAHELVDSYGTYADAHLMAKFGFQNGDGSGHTQASMAAMHRMMDAGLRQQFSYLPLDAQKRNTLVSANQKLQLARYLQFDDGHEECITAADSDEDTYKLKQLKLQHLMRLANDAKRWVVTFPPRNPNARPNTEQQQPLSFSKSSNIQFDGSHVLATCRLMVLTPSDFKGDAVAMLQDHLETHSSDAIFIEAARDASLEYRAHLCLARWTGINLHRFNLADAAAVAAYAAKIAAAPPTNSNDSERMTPEQWAAHHVVLGEVQTLEVLNQLAAAGAHQYAQQLRTELPTIRRLPCEWDYTKRLAESTEYI